MADKPKLFADLARPLYGNWTDLTVATYTARIIVHDTPPSSAISRPTVSSSS
jgi:hypothetical protein